jgi:hypothetical protein
MLITAVLIALGVYGVIFTTAGTTSVAIANRQADVTRSALAQARDALIGRSASDNNRPGSLPCPDTNDDGVAEIFAGSDCPSYVGRLPWKSLGLPDLRDANGERLWYSLSTRFRDNAAAEPINSDTKGNFTIYHGTTATFALTEVVAVIFAPGPTVSGQARGTVAEQNDAANYLDSTAGVNNATPLLNSNAPSFIRAPSSATFNDTLLAVTTFDLMPMVEKRVAGEILALLQAYRTAGGNWCNCYPWADHSDGSSNNDNAWGRVPLVSSSTSGSTPTPDWNDVGITTVTHPALAWLRNNQWWWPFFYAVSNSGLTVDGVSGYSVVLITTGPAGAGRPWTGGSWEESVDWQLYVDDSQNSDGGTNFQTPSSTAYARDRLYKL